jgi:Arc/MetJ family transcription regulator
MASNGAYYVHTNQETRTMRTTLNIDDALIEEARRLTGIDERTALIHEGLRALIARESGKRLAALGGSEPRLRRIPRRRSG